jgi:hypothetical protein
MTVDQILEEAVDFHRAMLKHLFSVSADDFESPIEEKFAAGLLACSPFRNNGEEVRIARRDASFKSAEAFPKEQVYCLPQVSIGEFRVDFLLLYLGRYVVVECDGHDYHERTPAQAERDKRRDRYMTAMGLPVLRFTGSEINRSALKCAMEALDVLIEERASV